MGSFVRSRCPVSRDTCGRGSSPYLPSMFLEMADLFNPFLSLRPSIAAMIICSRNMRNKHVTPLVVSSLHFASATTPPKMKKLFLYCLVKNKQNKPPRYTHQTSPTLWFLHHIYRFRGDLHIASLPLSSYKSLCVQSLLSLMDISNANSSQFV